MEIRIVVTMKAGYQVAVLLALLSLLNFCWWQSLTWSLIFSSYDWSRSKKRGHCFGELCTPLMYCGCTGCKALINWAGMLLYFLSYSWFGHKRCPDWNNIIAASFLRLRHHHSCSLRSEKASILLQAYVMRPIRVCWSDAIPLPRPQFPRGPISWYALWSHNI